MPPYASGDFWLLVVAARSTSAPQLPTDWTTTDFEQASTATSGVAVRMMHRAAADGVTSVEVTLNASRVSIGIAYPISGVDLDAPFSGTSTNMTTAGAGRGNNGGVTADTAMTNPGFTTLTADMVLFQVLAANTDGDTTFTHTAGFGDQVERHVDDGTTDVGLSIATRTQASAGATGACDASHSITGRWVDCVIGLAPDPDTTVTGTLAGTTPVPTAALTGTVTAEGTLTGAVPLPTATFAAQASTAAALAGATPLPTAALAGTVTASGALAGTVPLPTAAITAAADVDLVDITVTATLSAPRWAAEVDVDARWRAAHTSPRWAAQLRRD
jgi:hypothetical protein